MTLNTVREKLKLLSPRREGTATEATHFMKPENYLVMLRCHVFIRLLKTKFIFPTESLSLEPLYVVVCYTTTSTIILFFELSLMLIPNSDDKWLKG